MAPEMGAGSEVPGLNIFANPPTRPISTHSLDGAASSTLSGRFSSRDASPNSTYTTDTSSSLTESSKPLLILVPGAWHPAAHLSTLQSSLDALTLPSVAHTLPSVNNATATLSNDVSSIRSLLLHNLDLGYDVVIICHSYSGYPVSSAVHGLSKKERTAKGEAGGVLGMIYVCAFIPTPGIALLTATGGHFPDWAIPNYTTNLVHVPDPHHIFYHDIPEPLASKYANLLQEHSILAMQGIPEVAGHEDVGFDDRRIYIKTAKDRTISLEVQGKIVAVRKENWEVREMDTGHLPFLVDPDGLARLVAEVLEGWKGERKG